jgi:hypothetical protein
MATRTGLLSYGFQVTPGWHTALTVADGFCFLIKEVRLSQTTGDGSEVRIYLMLAGAGDWYYRETLSVGTARGVPVWTALPGPGSVLMQVIGPGTVSWWLSGAVLVGEASLGPQPPTLLEADPTVPLDELGLVEIRDQYGETLRIVTD